jgi:hypothetical protein
MTRSRLVVVGALMVVAVGVMVALAAFWLDPARASIGPLPGEALVLPSDSTLVLGLDVKRVAASTFYRKFARERGARPQALTEFTQKTGIDPERDIDRVVFAAGKDAATDSVALISGRFDRARLAAELAKTLKSKTVAGVTVYDFGGAQSSGIAILDDHTLIAGVDATLARTLVARAEGGQGLRGNHELIELLTQVKPGSTFWVVGDRTLVGKLPRAIPAPGGGSSELSLPALKGLTITGDLEPLVTINATGITADAAAAGNLADVLRGLAALLAIQSSQKPELKQLASALSITTENERVHLNGRFSYELLDAMTGRTAPQEQPQR